MANYEALYTVAQYGDRYYITGFTERKAAEKLGVRHLTVIIVPFVEDGKDKGKWIVHDRSAKQWAKGNPDCKSPSYNLFGGHCTADTLQLELVGSEIPMEICRSAAKRELDEELLRQGKEKDEKKKKLEVWEKRIKTDKHKDAIAYQSKELIPVGLTSYEAHDNVELSYVFALPVPSSDVDKLIAADDYKKDHHVLLPTEIMAESDLQTLFQTNPNIEICDAITRLWNEETRWCWTATKPLKPTL